MTENVRLYISIPSNRKWEPEFGMAFAYLMSYLSSAGIKADGYAMELARPQLLRQSSNLSKSRQYFVDDMIANNFTHWLSLDDDMTFPPDIVDRLISHGKDIVSCNARFKEEKLIGSCQGLDGQPLNSSKNTGLEELMTMGGAIFLAKIDAFKHIPKPHFQVLWSKPHNDYVSEDVHFAALLRANGIKLWADHDTSKQIGHIGDREYKWPEETNIINLRTVAA